MMQLKNWLALTLAPQERELPKRRSRTENARQQKAGRGRSLSPSRNDSV